MERQCNLFGLGLLTVSQVLYPRSSSTLKTAFHFIQVLPSLIVQNSHQSSCFSSTLPLPFLQRINYIVRLYLYMKAVFLRFYPGSIIPKTKLFQSICSKFTTTEKKYCPPRSSPFLNASTIKFSLILRLLVRHLVPYSRKVQR